MNMKRGLIKDKKGLELAINTLVIMVLAIVLLAFLVVFFTGTAGNFMDKIKSYFSYSNVDNVVESCNILSSTNSQYSFCCEKKSVKYYEDGEKREGEFSCNELTDKSFGGNVEKLNCGELNC